MKERPILFQGEMVRAILDGSKTQTRRVLKPMPPAEFGIQMHRTASGYLYAADYQQVSMEKPQRVRWDCPYGQPGDRLWVRETFYCDHAFYPDGVSVECQWREVDGKRIPIPIAEQRAGMIELMYYRADGEPEFEGAEGRTPWRPSIHMPRWACRLNLEITGVRVERLNDCSEADALAEGIQRRKVGSGDARTGLHTVYGLGGDNDHASTATAAYRDLWERINGAGSWEANPFVWVVEFKQIQVAPTAEKR